MLVGWLTQVTLLLWSSTLVTVGAVTGAGSAIGRAGMVTVSDALGLTPL